MKKIFALILATALTTTVSAQSIRLFHNGQPLENGEYVTTLITPGTISHTYIGYANVSDDDLYLRVKREDVQFVEGDDLTFCVGGSCSSTMSGEFFVMMGDTITTDNENMVFHADYTCSPSHPGNENSITKFTFYNTDDESDAVYFYLKSTTNVGVQQFEASQQVSAYPNPATTSVNISFRTSTDEGANLIIRNIVGSEVYRQHVSGEGKVLVSTADMAPGIYVYGLEQNGVMNSVKKLLVK